MIKMKLLLCALLLIFSTQVTLAQTQDKPAKRIIALAPHIVENLYLIGAGNLIVGTTDHADYPEAAKKIPRVGNYATLNIEQILAADPDLVIAWKTGSSSEDLERLKKFGINIEFSNPKVPEDVAKEIRFLGKLTGFEAQAEKQAQLVLSKIAKIRAKYTNKKPIRTFYELWPRPLTTAAKDAWLQHQITICGAINPFADAKTDYPQVNIEDVILKAPQVIIQPTSHSSNTPDQIDWQQWPALPAVKNKAFVRPDADKLYRTTSRSFDELDVLCQSIDSYRANYN